MKRFSRHYILTAIMGAIAAAIGPGAWAADWQQFDKNERVTSFIDRGSQVREESIYSAWIKSVYAKQQNFAGKRGGASFVQTVELIRMDCSNRVFYLDQRIYSSVDGTQVRTEPGSAKREYVVPDSASERRYAAICKEAGTKISELASKGIYYKPLEQPKSRWNPFR